MCGFGAWQPFGYCWANRGRNGPMSALSETPEMASPPCGFGSNPPRKSRRPGWEIILPSHCMCSATICGVRALPSPLPGHVDGSWWPQGPQGRHQAGSSCSHSSSWRVGAGLRLGTGRRCHYIPVIGHCRQHSPQQACPSW